MSYADYMHCPGCDGKAIYMGDREDPDGVVAWHARCLELETSARIAEALAVLNESATSESR